MNIRLLSTFFLLCATCWAWYLRVNLNPEEANGRWCVEDGIWHDSGEKIEISSNESTIFFEPKDGWEEPSYWKVVNDYQARNIVVSASYKKDCPADSVCLVELNAGGHCPLVILAAPSGGDGYDAAEDVKATALDDGQRTLCWSETAAGEKLEWDMRALAEEMSWPVTIQCADGEGTVLSWSLEKLPSGCQALLTGGKLGEVDMSAVDSVVLEGSGSHSLCITLKLDGIQSRSFTLGRGWNCIHSDLQGLGNTGGEVVFRAEGGRNRSATLDSPGVLWIFSKTERTLELWGCPASLESSQPVEAGWLGVTEELDLPEGTVAWEWRRDHYEATGHLVPGRGYYVQEP